MTPIKADWLSWPLSQKLAKALGPAHVRFVGGAVRDTVIGKPIKDIDAATQWPPEETMRRLEAEGFKAIPTGLDHGTVTALLDGKTVEVTTLRHDVETHGRHATVAFTDDWLEDAKRRDFTMNALYLSADGTLFDPFGGEEDVKAGRVKFIGEATQRIQEDALRIMRFFRFHAHYGKGALDADGLRATKKQAALLENLSAERVRDELLKLLAAPDPVPCLKAMTEAGLWPHTPIMSVDCAMTERIIGAEARYGFDLDVLARLAALVGEGRADVGKKLKLSNQQQENLSSSCLGLELRVPGNAAAMRSLIYQYGRRAGAMTVLMAIDEVEAEKVEAVRSWDIPVFPVKGRDLIALGAEPGPEISRTLYMLERKWRENDFKLTSAELLALVPNQRH